MKKILAILCIIILFSGCKKLEDLNVNTKDPTNVTGESLFTGAQKNFVDQITGTNVNFNINRLIMQYWTEVTYVDESNYDLVTRTIPDNHWDILYRDVLKDLKESARIINETTYSTDPSPKVKSNKLAIIEIMNVYAYSILVETFGNVPYTNALDIENPSPEYDDGLYIYKDLITRLNSAIGTLDPAWGSFGIADNIYAGDVTQWLKFANSLKLKMGMILADKEPAYAQTVVEAAAPNVLLSNADNATFVYLSSAPNQNPIYEDLVASGRHDFVPTSTIVDVMNTLSDPRRPFYFTEFGGAYVGGPNGVVSSYGDYSHVADAMQVPTFPAVIMEYAEVEFLLAEAVERGYAVGGTAEDHYNNGVTASITYWGGTAGEATAYLANPAVAYPTAGATWQEKIGNQMWIALYNRGFESWTYWRKYDFPVLTPAPDAVAEADGKVPVRFTYPIAEQTLNGNSYSSASSAIGGDFLYTKLFWDLY